MNQKRYNNTSRFLLQQCSASRGSVAVFLVILIAAAGVMSWSKTYLRTTRAQALSSEQRPPLYLPEAQYVKLVTLGFNNFASDILWFNTVNYFGKQYMGTQDYRWLAQMCDLVTSLNGNALHVYEFCATLLSWVAKEPTESNRLLTRAISQHDDVWRLHYLKGFNYWYFLENKELAKSEFTIASRLTDAPPFLASLASRLMATTDSPRTAINFLKDLIEHTSDKTAKEALTDKLKRAVLSNDIQLLERLTKAFKNSFERLPKNLAELVEVKLITRLPIEPFGGNYTIDPQTGEIRSSSGEKGLNFAGKTARTGAFKHEYK